MEPVGVTGIIMVDLSTRLELVRRMAEDGEYFIISRVRQYGKTTLLCAITDDVKDRLQDLADSGESCRSDIWNSLL